MTSLDPTLVMLLIVARRIARTHRTNPEVARADYLAHASAMTPGEIETFDRMIVDSAIQAA